MEKGLMRKTGWQELPWENSPATGDLNRC